MNQLTLLAEFPEQRTKPELPLNSFMVKACMVGEPEIAPKVDAPELCADYWRNVVTRQDWFDANKEHLIVLQLNGRYNVTGYSLISIGTINECHANPACIFRPTVAAGSFAFVVMHNHPSGDPSPSQSDHSLTRRLSEGAELLQIKMLDHVIVGQPAPDRQSYYSFKETGVL